MAVATEGGDFTDALDATVSPDGRDIFFTAMGPQGAGVFGVPASGGTAVPVFTGAPFVPLTSPDAVTVSGPAWRT